MDIEAGCSEFSTDVRGGKLSYLDVRLWLVCSLEDFLWRGYYTPLRHSDFITITLQKFNIIHIFVCGAFRLYQAGTSFGIKCSLFFVSYLEKSNKAGMFHFVWSSL